MKLFRNLLFLVFMFSIMAIFSQCATGKQLETNLPFKIGDVYYQEKVAGVKGGDSGATIFITLQENPNNIILDSVYFQGKEAKLELRNNTDYIGRFESKTVLKNDIIMSIEPYAEYGNKAPKIPKKPRFQLEEDECIVSYKVSNKVKYFKIGKINKKEAL